MNWLSGTRLWLRARYAPRRENMGIHILMKRVLPDTRDRVICRCPTKMPREKAVTRTNFPIRSLKQPKFCAVSAATAADPKPIIGNTSKTLRYTRQLVSVHESGPSALRFKLRPTTIWLSTSFLRHGHVRGNRISMQHELCLVQIWKGNLNHYPLFCLSKRTATISSAEAMRAQTV